MKIEPYKAVGPVQLGMTAADVKKVLGPEQRASGSRKGEREEHWEGMIVRYAKDKDAVVEITLFPPSRPQISGIELFTHPERYRELCIEDGNPYDCLGFLVLLTFGVAMTGFHDQDVAQRAITVFERGRWDGLQRHFVKYQYH